VKKKGHTVYENFTRNCKIKDVYQLLQYYIVENVVEFVIVVIVLLLPLTRENLKYLYQRFEVQYLFHTCVLNNLPFSCYRCNITLKHF